MGFGGPAPNHGSWILKHLALPIEQNASFPKTCVPVRMLGVYNGKEGLHEIELQLWPWQSSGEVGVPGIRVEL